jgi:hypothetical protein
MKHEEVYVNGMACRVDTVIHPRLLGFNLQTRFMKVSEQPPKRKRKKDGRPENERLCS